MEVRRLFFDAELTVEHRAESDPPKISGYFARYGVKSSDLGGWREILRPGVFAESLKRGDEVFALWNHNSDKPFARTGNGTVVLREDEKGLWADVTPDDTSWGQDAIRSVKAKTVVRTSFAFAIEDRKDQEWSDDGKLREVVKASLFDVSPVTYPAYPQPRISARAQRLSALTADLERGLELRGADLLFVGEELERLQRALDGLRSGDRGRSGEGGGGAEESAVLAAASRERLEAALRDGGGVSK